MSEANAAKRADFDLDARIDGTTGITGLARIIQRGDLLAEVDRLEAELEVARRVPAGDRGVGDRSSQQIRDELDQVVEQIWSTTLVLHVQDRTEGRREQIRERLRKQGVSDADTISLHVIADAIVRVETPDGRVVPLPEGGFPASKLREIRDRLGDSALLDLARVFREVTSQAPAVPAPLSHAPSSTRDGTTSRSRSGRRGSGASRRA